MIHDRHHDRSDTSSDARSDARSNVRSEESPDDRSGDPRKSGMHDAFSMRHASQRATQPPNEHATNDVTRRRFLARVGLGAVALVGSMSTIARTTWSAEPAMPAIPTELLSKSSFVYISPLRKDGHESRCHSEVWYAWIDESVVVTVASSGWKARALARGLDRARLWVGNHGRWKSFVGPNNEAFRSAPSFEARAEKVEDPKMIDRLLESYDRKYPAEIESWRDKMRSGNADGSRIMIRYSPIGR
jgi:hypothetical protein